MPELLSEEDTRTAFADLRATEIGNVRPPGTDTVRRTVRRRKATRAVTVAGCLALAVSGGFALLQNYAEGPAPVSPPSPGPAPASPPSPQAVSLQQLGREAKMALDIAFPSSGRIVFGGSGPLDSIIEGDDSFEQKSAYRLTVACVGAGSVHAEVLADGTTLEDDVACGRTSADAAADAKEFAIPGPTAKPHSVSVLITPDAGALHHAGFAFQVRPV